MEAKPRSAIRSMPPAATVGARPMKSPPPPASPMKDVEIVKAPFGTFVCYYLFFISHSFLFF